MMTLKATSSITACRIADRSCGDRSSPGCLAFASPPRGRINNTTWRLVHVKCPRDIRKESGSWCREVCGDIRIETRGCGRSVANLWGSNTDYLEGLYRCTKERSGQKQIWSRKMAVISWVYSLRGYNCSKTSSSNISKCRARAMANLLGAGIAVGVWYPKWAFGITMSVQSCERRSGLDMLSRFLQRSKSLTWRSILILPVPSLFND